MLQERANSIDTSYFEILSRSCELRKLEFLNITNSINRIKNDINSNESEDTRCIALERLHFILYCLVNNIDPKGYIQIGVNHPFYVEQLIKPNDIVLPVWGTSDDTGILEMSDDSWGEDSRVVIWREVKSQEGVMVVRLK